MSQGPESAEDLRATRRGVLLSGTGLAAAALGGTVASGALAHNDEPYLGNLRYGIVRRSEAHGELLVSLKGENSVTRVRLAPGTVPNRRGPARLSDFSPGDEVSVGGSRDGGVLMAKHFELTFRLVETRVRSTSARSLRTDAGDLRLVEISKARGGHALGHELEAVPLDQLSDGDAVVALGVHNAADNGFTALQIGRVVH